MRLLDTTTGELVWLSDTKMEDTPYAILSHVWGESEQSYQDVSAIPPLPSASPMHDMREDPRFPAASSRLNPKLSPKIRGACIYAFSLGFRWIWIDTCCIDKASSAELSEAINSMFKWYAKASVCIAYLEDVRDPTDASVFLGDNFSPFHNPMKSKWFTRGWTLQELVAPRVVEFVSRGWMLLGTKAGMAARLEQRTHVDAAVLRLDRALSTVCVADRMRWAAKRETTRVEDRAYSLLGIFGVNLPTLYGEGKAAFQRLQEAIMASSSDATLFMWNRPMQWRPWLPRAGLLASVPEDFLDTLFLSVMPVEQIPASVDAFLGALNARTPWTQKSSSQLPSNTPSFTKTSHGVRTWIPLIRCARSDDSAIAVVAVKCQGQYQGLALERASTTRTLHHYTVARTIAPSTLPEIWSVWYGDTYSAEWADIYITDAVLPSDLSIRSSITLNVPPWVISRMSRHYGFFLQNDGAGGGFSPVHGVKLAQITNGMWTMGWPSSPPLTFASVDPQNRDPETLQIEFSTNKSAQSGVELLGFYIYAVTLNGRKANIFPGPASVERGDGTIWLGDADRAVGFTALSGQNDDRRELDITLSGRVYERYGQIYGAQWRAPSLAADDSVRPPSLPSTRDTSSPTAAGEDLSEDWPMTSDAMAPLRAELASARAELAQVDPRLAAAEEAARVAPHLAAAEKVARLKQARVVRRRRRLRGWFRTFAAAQKVARVVSAEKVARLRQVRAVRRRL